ncbi:MAG: STAS/SEC14 domain-containing protein [Candidatus Competibacter sp.]|nr:STAS/SEC14 domain-containing protein [Candidatus Competibacter sp.]MDG4583752.1 STAS/SEC14 domain-containing protein [Candidatus Competibacter sp.]
MTIAVRQMTNRVHRVRVSGTLSWNDFQDFLRESEALMIDGKIGLLIELENFAGWEPSERWGDVSFFLKHDADIEKIAIVGDPRWREEALLFTFAGMRQAEVRFFPELESELARVWLTD